MNFQIQCDVGALFKLVVRKANGDIKSETDWFPNIVLDTGLNRMSVGTAVDRCCVGTGNSTPVATQTALDAFLVSTTGVNGGDVTGSNTTTTPYYNWARRTWRFAQGVATGNISEVGLGWGNANLWNRALIKDGNGNPTTISVLSDEILDVVSEVREYPVASISGSFNLLDKFGATVSTHTYTGKPLIRTSGAMAVGKVSAYAFQIYSGSMNAGVTTNPSGSYSYVGAESSYPTPTSCRGVATLQTTQSNYSHKSFAMKFAGLLSNAGNDSSSNGYQIEITPAITKTSAQIMTYTFEVSWGRYTP